MGMRVDDRSAEGGDILQEWYLAPGVFALKAPWASLVSMSRVLDDGTEDGDCHNSV